MNKAKKPNLRLITGEIVLLLLLFMLFISPPTNNISGYAEIFIYRLYQSNLTSPAFPDSTPVITMYYPAETRPVLIKPNALNFNIEANDPNDEQLNYQWYLDGTKLIGTTFKTYTFSSSFREDKFYNVTVAVSNRNLTTTQSWDLEVASSIEDVARCIGKCCGVVCPQTSILCDDGTPAICQDYCEPSTGICVSCTPVCVEYPAQQPDMFEPYFDPLKETPVGRISRRTIPCVNVTYTERKKIELTESEFTDLMKIPKDYSPILKPFTVECNGEPLEMTVSIPNNYEDIKLLRCSDLGCYSNIVTYVTSLECGGKIVKELLRENTFVPPELETYKLKETEFNISSFKQALRTGSVEISFHGDIFENLSTILGSAQESLPEAKNPNLKIIGTPIVVKFANSNLTLDSTITMPYEKADDIDENSIAIYVRLARQWIYLDSDLDKEKQLVTANLTNIRDYLNRYNELNFAVMGAICISCFNSSFEKIYMPDPPARDAIILIHGLASSPATYQELIDDITLTQQPFQLWTFAYPTDRSILENAAELADYLELHSNEYDNIYIVAHSLGSLILQPALYNSYLANKNFTKYSFVNKTKKAVLIGSPNEGTPAIDIYRNLFVNLINVKSRYRVLTPNSPVLDEMVKGFITPRVPGIEYYVIAGIKPLSYNLAFFKLSAEGAFDVYEKNDGVVTVKSAQHVGEDYIDDQCMNYWELNLTHTDLIDDYIARQVIEKIITEEMGSEQFAFLSKNQYYKLKVDKCLPGDKFIVIGKKIPEEKLFDPTGCSCGNGFCGKGENAFNCPADCAIFLAKKSLFINILKIILVLFIIAIIVVPNLYRQITEVKEIRSRKIMDYIKNNFRITAKKGYTEEELLPELLSEDFSKREINEAFKIIHHEFYNNYLILRNYIKESLERGHAQKAIAEELLKSGWKKDIVDAAFEKHFIAPYFQRIIPVEAKSKEKQLHKFFRLT